MTGGWRAWRVAAAVFALVLAPGCAQMPGGVSESEQLYHAIELDDVGFVQRAVQSGRIHPDYILRAPGYLEGAPLILYAAKYAALRTLRYLISAGANVNARAPTGETALMLASYFGPDHGTSSRQEEAVRILVDAGAHLENLSHHYTPLAYAAYRGHLRIINYLLQRGARVDGDAQGGLTYVNTPLMMAAIQGHREAVASLLRAGANPRTRLYQGHTAAELAMKNNHLEVLRLLRCAERLGPGESFQLRCR